MLTHEVADLSFRLGPDAAPVPKAVDKAAVLRGQKAEAEIAHPGLGEEIVDVGSKLLVHTAQFTRKCVQCKCPQDRACTILGYCYLSRMDSNGWKQRLWSAIDADERTDRALSLAAGLGPNYVQQMRDRGGAPKIDAAEKLCAVMGISLLYVMTGLPIDEEGEELIRLAAGSSPSQRHHLVQLLRGSGEDPART